MKKLILPIIFVIVAIVGYFAYETYFKEPARRHIHAGIQVYVNGTLQDFSSARYMSLKPCSEPGTKATQAQLQEEKAHLHDNVGDVAHSHREGATWGDFFKNISYTFPEGNVTADVNGNTVNNILNQHINAYDSVVIFVGDIKNKNDALRRRVTKAHIVDVEQKSEGCGTD